MNDKLILINSGPVQVEFVSKPMCSMDSLYTITHNCQSLLITVNSRQSPIQLSISHFIVVCFVTKHLSGSEAGADLVFDAQSF